MSIGEVLANNGHEIHSIYNLSTTFSFNYISTILFINLQPELTKSMLVGKIK